MKVLTYFLLAVLTTHLVLASNEFSSVFVEFGSNLGSTVPARLTDLLRKVPNIKFYSYDPSMDSVIDSSSLVISFGNTSRSLTSLPLSTTTAEGFQIMSEDYLSGSLLITCNGQPINAREFNYAMNVDAVHYGAAVASYAVLELLGFGFLHPLETIVPSSLVLKERSISVSENPYWTKRTWHIHTQHPLEFTDVLNGFDVPMHYSSELNNCPPDTHCESWDSMFETLHGLFEWMLPNKQNRVEALLLGNAKWGNLTDGTTRQNRLRAINRLAHEYGILMGADVPLANLQQHGWAMISLRDSLEKQKADIEDRVDWVFDAEYDFISTESGLSEFTKPTCDLMLQLFNIFTTRAASVWGRDALTKVHCSTDQYCQDVDESTGQLKYPDPRTGAAINFNLLPTYAMPELGVMPHTVQVYSFDDPTAGAYGNDNFGYMFDYMKYESSLGVREVQYYGETAYWVNVDVDVPLFLPLTGQRRLSDMRKAALGGAPIDGQMNFESGWEFGYYLSNAVTARAAWNPQLDITDDWDAFKAALQPLMSIFGAMAEEVTDELISLSRVQADVLVFSKVHGETPEDLSKLSGHAYMSGADTWVDLPRMLGMSLTQPDKIHLDELDDPQWPEMVAIQSELSRVFNAASQRFDDMLVRARAVVQQNAIGVLEELVDAVKLLSLKADHTKALYDAMAEKEGGSERNLLLRRGRQLLADATEVMSRRSTKYRVPLERVAGWRQGPTVYPYGYIWASNSLYYLWRDQGIAEGKSLMASTSPCYLNRIEPIELAFGYGKALEQALRLRLKKKGLESNETLITDLIADCLAPPLMEYKFPRDL